MAPVPYYSDESVTLYHGDAIDVLRQLPDETVQCCVTSPPYYGLRDYQQAGQYGAENTPGEFVDTMRTVFSEVRRVLTPDGTLFLNLGDTYASTRNHGVPAKNLLGIPWRVAFALQQDGWILRNAIVWDKPNATPASVTDRFAVHYEHVFMFSRHARYWFDLDAVRVPQSDASIARARRADHRTKTGWADAHHGNPPRGLARQSQRDTSVGANPGDVWAVPTVHAPGAHFACMPPALAERCIKAGCRPGGTVLDPFNGSGTTGLAAAGHGHPYVGIDLNSGYLDLSLQTRLAQPVLALR